MAKPLQAVLLSALVFPGVGQIVSGHKKRGWSIVAVCLLLLIFFIREIMLRAYAVLEKMQQQGVMPDINTVSQLSAELSGFSDNLMLNGLLLALIAVWLLSIVDAYWCARKAG